MNLAMFRATLDGREPPPGLGLALQALWWDAKGDWNRAHACAQDDHSADGAHVHAYLHRKAGDQPNARHWYRRAGGEPATGLVDAESVQLIRDLLGDQT
jgi:hypothetical protein